MDDLHGRKFQRGEAPTPMISGPRIKFKLVPGGRMPERANPHDACFDCFANIKTMTQVGITPAMIPLGIQILVPPGWEAQIRPRSSKFLVGLYAHPGTIDCGFTQELCLLISYRPCTPLGFSGDPYYVAPGEKICQLAFSPVWEPTWEEVEDIGPSRGGFGSSGL